MRFDSLGERLTLRAWRGAGRGGGPSAARALALPSGDVLHTYAHGESTFGVSLSADDRFVATNGGKHDIRTVALWRARTGAPIVRRDLGGIVRFANLEFSADGEQLAVGQRADDGRTQIHLLSTVDLEPIRILELPVPGIPDFLRFVGDDHLVFGTEAHLGIVDLDDGAVRAFDAELRRVLQVSPRRDRLVHRSGSDLVLRSLPDLAPVGFLDTEGSAVEAVSFTADGAFVAVGSFSSDVLVFEADTGRRVRRLPGHDSLVLGAEFFGGDEPLLVTGSRDGTLRLWPRAVPGVEAARRAHFADAAAVMLLPARDRHALVDGVSVAIAGAGLPFRWAQAGGAARCVASSRDGRRVLVSGAGVDNAEVWALDGDKPRRLGVLPGRRQHRCALSGDGAMAVRINVDGVVATLDTVTGAVATFEGGPANVQRIQLTDDGRLAYGGNADGLLFSFDPRAPEAIDVWGEFDEGWSAVVASPDAQRFVGARWDGSVQLMERGGAEIAALVGHTDGVLHAQFSPDGTVVATGSWDRTARLWDGRTGEARHVLQHPDGDVTAIDFSDDGAVLWTGSKDRRVRAWDVASGRLLAVHDGHTGPVRAVQALADGGARSVGTGRTLAVWPRPPSAGEDPGLAAGALTNLRVCEGTGRVVPVIPFPPPETTLAPPEACR